MWCIYHIQESKIGTRRKLLIVRPKFGKGNHTARATETHKKRSAVISDSDDDDHVPHVIPKRRLFDHRSSLTGKLYQFTSIVDM
ncbi:hypothetical protein AHAS_Ahas11G0148400 [Arachis hypogaea]